jgi:hypothetical protein
MGSAVSDAKVKPLVGSAPRWEARAPASGILTLTRLQSCDVSTFDAQDYALIDFMLVTNQWAALVQVGRTLRIVFSDGAVIALLNSFSYSSAYDAFSRDGYVGTRPAGAVVQLLRTSDNQILTSHAFAKSYWITKTSGAYLIVLPSEHRDGVQALGPEIGPHPSDIAPLPTPPDLFRPSPPDFRLCRRHHLHYQRLTAIPSSWRPLIMEA